MGIACVRLMQTTTDGPTRALITLSGTGVAPVLSLDPTTGPLTVVLEPPLPYVRYRLADMDRNLMERAGEPGLLTTLTLTGLVAGLYMLRVDTPVCRVYLFRVVHRLHQDR
jgi:hypothetical protein